MLAKEHPEWTCSCVTPGFIDTKLGESERPRGRDRLKLQTKKKQSELRAGQPGAPLLAHERSKWLHLQLRSTPTQEWQDAMHADAGFLLRYLQPPKYCPGQLEAICKVCSLEQNKKFISNTNTMSTFFPEPAPRI